MIRVIIADDHTIFRQGLSKLLSSESDIEVIGEAGDGDAALALILEKRPDVAVIDISMPGKNGIEVLREARETDTGIIILTMHRDALRAAQALNSGAKGYLLKDGAVDELVSAIVKVNEGKRYISPSVSAELMLYTKQAMERPVLTERENSVLKLIAGGLSNREIAERLCISIKTVETHRAKIMNKLDLHKVADLVRYAFENGIVLE